MYVLPGNNLSLSQIATAYGGPPTTSLSMFMNGGTYVYDSSIPSHVPLSMSAFFNKANTIPIPVLNIVNLTCNSVVIAWSNMSTVCSAYQTTFNGSNYNFPNNVFSNTFTGLTSDTQYSFSMNSCRAIMKGASVTVSFLTNSMWLNRYASVSMLSCNNVYNTTLDANKYVMVATDQTGNRLERQCSIRHHWFMGSLCIYRFYQRPGDDTYFRGGPRTNFR
jgi:hypothetical protein